VLPPALPTLYLGPVAVPTQGVLAVAGLVVGHVVFVREVRLRAGLPAMSAELLAIVLTASAILGGHLLGGLLTGVGLDLRIAAHQSSLGAVLGGTIALGVAARWRHWDPRRLTDAATWGACAGWPIVRLGCALVHDHPGRRSVGWLSAAMADGPRLDVGAVEALLAVPLSALAFHWGRQDLPRGVLAARLLGLAATARMTVELLRIDGLEELGRPAAVATGLACACAWFVSAAWSGRQRGSPLASRAP
jgi:phosphatidylglycerol:prolipoprotein diacylglycerol transferase